MTRTRFAFAALLQSFGFERKIKRLTDAAFEMHLMQDGEELLGAYCWKNVEDIEELSMEYWNLRKLEREEEELNQKLEDAEATLLSAQSRRADLVDRSKDDGQEQLQERENLFEEIEDLLVEKDEIMAEAAITKRKHSALQMKAEVLKEEGSENTTELLECRQQLEELKAVFTENKNCISQITLKINSLEEKLEEIQNQIDQKQQGTKGASDESFVQISKANRDITKFRADLGLITDEQAAIYREIGRFLNINSNRPDCKAACQAHRGLQEQTRLLYSSVQWNRRLVERIS